MWMRMPDDGLAAVVYAPNTVQTQIKGASVTVELITNYPFDEVLTFHISAEQPVEFTLYLRIPEWAANAVITDESGKETHPKAGSFHEIKRKWHKKMVLTMTLPSKPHLVHRGKAVSLVKEPLVYALKIGEDWRRIHADLPFRELPHADWEVFPTTPWNYALLIKDDDLDSSFIFSKHPITSRPFSPDGAPITVVGQGVRIPKWQAENGDAGAVPVLRSANADLIETITLIPYGCTNLRITEFPVLKNT
jgi:hypothetical protein